jgi:alpha-mannosidase
VAINGVVDLQYILRLGLALGGLAGALTLGAAEKRIYLAPDDHTDYMWSAGEEAYRQAFVEMIDYYMDLAAATKNDPREHQSRWNCDGSFWVWTYEKNSSPAAFERLVARIRSGQISMPLNALVSCYGGMPAEAVLRGMYYAGSLERRYGLRFPIAIAMENQTLPYGLGALFAGSGARYSWKGICGCLTKIPNNVRRPHEIYWWKGADGSRMLMKWNTLFGNNQSIGGYAEARQPAEAVEFVERDPGFQAAYPYPVIGIFGKGWDDLKTLTDEFVTVAKQKTTAGRKVIVSNQTDFFEDFESSHGAALPEFNAAFGNEWDLYTASLTEVSARVRRAVERLRAAEALASLVSLEWPEFLNGRQAFRDQTWINLGLYWEHNWTADGRVLTRQSRADWGRRVAAQIESYVDTLHGDATFALGGLIAARTGSRRFYVFNPLGWTRTDSADLLYGDPGPVHVIDLATGEETPSQLVTLAVAGYQQGRRYLRVHAVDVPPAGYKVFEIRQGQGQEYLDAARVAGSVVENAVYRLVVADRGAITSLVDKARGNRELARAVDGRWINDLGPGGGMLEAENAGPVSVTVKARGSGPLEHVSRITLLRDSPRIDIRNEITQNFGDTHTWSFAFDFESPDVWHEEVGAVIRARLLSGGGHYSPTHSRLEWLTLNHFAAMTGSDGMGVLLSNSDCAFMKLGRSAIGDDGISRLDVETPQIQVLAGGQIDGPQAGIPMQGGDSHFLQRFALQTTGAYSPAEAMRFALEHQNPFVTGWVRGNGPYPEQSFSLLSISDENVLLWSLKPAEEGIRQGLIARVWNLASSPRPFSIALATGVGSAKRATHIETDIERLPVSTGRLSTRIAGSQMLTFRLMPGRRPASR